MLNKYTPKLNLYKLLYPIILDIYRGLRTAIVLFKPYNIFKLFLYLVSFGIISDLLICLPYQTQMSLFILFFFIVVEHYDNNKLNIKLFIAKVFHNKTYYFTFFILRSLGIYLIITFLACMLPLDLAVIHFNLLPYLQVSSVKKLLLFSFLGEVFSLIGVVFLDISIHLITFPEVIRCDSGDDWDKFFSTNPAAIKPCKSNLSLVDPDINRTKSKWMYVGTIQNKEGLKPYYWNQYHPNSLEVYYDIQLPSDSSPRIISPNPVPDSTGFYIRTVDKIKHTIYTPLNFTNKTTHAPLYVKTTSGRYIKTPFKLQPGLLELRF